MKTDEIDLELHRLRLENDMAIRISRINAPVFNEYTGMEYTPLHKKSRASYSRESFRCGYCACIPENPWGKCEYCGAPL